MKNKMLAGLFLGIVIVTTGFAVMTSHAKSVIVANGSAPVPPLRPPKG
jgi:hypothetical protein